MFWAIRQLSVPLNYLRIRNGSGVFHSKRTYDFVLPVIFAAATCGYFWWLAIPFELFGHPAMIKRLSDLLALMIVFYMAALAAVATFERKGIDDELAGDPAKLWVRNKDDRKKWDDKILSYRQFISYLFGYLSFLSLTLYVFVMVFDEGWRKLELHFLSSVGLHDALVHYVDPLIFFVVIAAVWQLIITSLLGIYFLTERLQTLNKSP